MKCRHSSMQYSFSNSKRLTTLPNKPTGIFGNCSHKHIRLTRRVIRLYKTRDRKNAQSVPFVDRCYPAPAVGYFCTFFTAWSCLTTNSSKEVRTEIAPGDCPALCFGNELIDRAIQAGCQHQTGANIGVAGAIVSIKPSFSSTTGRLFCAYTDDRVAKLREELLKNARARGFFQGLPETAPQQQSKVCIGQQKSVLLPDLP